LRTILTRFKLQLALAGDNPDLRPLNKDVADMQTMLEGYLSFARGDVEEEVGRLRLSDLFDKFAMEAELHERAFTSEIEGDDEVMVRPNAFSRLVGNLVSNALRYAKTVHVEAKLRSKWLTITV